MERRKEQAVRGGGDLKTVDMNADFFVVLCSAVRYCIGRETYIPKLVTDYVIHIKKDIPTEFLTIMMRDIEEDAHMISDKHFRMLWDGFYREIAGEIKQRGDVDDFLQGREYGCDDGERCDGNDASRYA